jgi:hypothetical protein
VIRYRPTGPLFYVFGIGNGEEAGSVKREGLPVCIPYTGTVIVNQLLTTLKRQLMKPGIGEAYFTKIV